MKKIVVEPEFSRPVPVEKVTATGIEQDIRADEAERRKLAARFGLLELRKLEAALQAEVTPAGQIIKVTGTFTADVVQQCVVTLEPLDAHVEQPVEGLFAKGEMQGGAFLIEPETQNIEPVEDNIIDLGELVAQHLGAALDPYPRKPGLALLEAQYGTTEMGMSGNVSPFARLAEIKGKPKK